MNWYALNERKPDPFVSVLVYMPSEDPLPIVHEGYMAEDNTWWSNGYFRTDAEISYWTEMPEFKAPDPRLPIMIERENFFAALRAEHRAGFEEGVKATVEYAETHDGTEDKNESMA